MIPGLFDNGALPVLERMVQFTSARQRVLADNIANISTPGFKPRELDPKEFQKALGQAIEARRANNDGPTGELNIADTPDLTFRSDGIDVNTRPANEGILFHDQNNRDLERLMQHLAENTLVHNAGIEMMRSQYDVMMTAIRERV